MPALELKLGSIPLKIQGSFLLMALLLGLNERDPAKLALWVAIVLVSVIIHELGHALVGKAFGLTPRIELHGMGGLTFFNGGRAEMSTGKSIAISLAGPFAGFVFAFVVVATQVGGFHPIHPLAREAVRLLLWVNVGWGVFNLLPMLPLDGGNVLRSIASAITKPHGEKIARVLSIVVAAGIALLAVQYKQWWVLYLGVLYGFQNVQGLRQAGQLRVDQTLADAIERGYAALDRREHKEVAAVLKPALETQASPELRQVGLRIYVVALLREGEWSEVMDVVERERRVIGSEDLGRFSQAMRELGRDKEAERIDELVKAPAPLSEFRA
ncbi:MAG: site-2 protease family protein [Labilithrix sp.]|nr:site-2 protease family protein [Labilithrix sp.]MBX3220562.1 site-2 protease family protein [Labilithrix sp.]